MITSLAQWFERRFIGTEWGTLLLFLLAIILSFWWISSLITPVVISVIIAYLLERIVNLFVGWKLPRNLSVHLVYLLFLGLSVFGFLVLLPLLWDQLSLLFAELPIKIKQVEGYLTELSQHYPNYLSKAQTQSWITTLQANSTDIGKHILSFSVSTVSKIMAIVVYLVLVPMMVYFFMKDNVAILKWLGQFIPKKRQLLQKVWIEVDQQMGHYIASKVVEMLLVGIGTTIAFFLLGLNYAALLGVLVGVSVLVPYVGVILVTIPVVVVGYMQWGFDVHFLYLSITYVALMIVDGNILTPLLFAETMKIHPVAVIIAILLFGGLWGFWGIFFAIPLASVTKVLLNAWVNNK